MQVNSDDLCARAEIINRVAGGIASDGERCVNHRGWQRYGASICPPLVAPGLVRGGTRCQSRRARGAWTVSATCKTCRRPSGRAGTARGRAPDRNGAGPDHAGGERRGHHAAGPAARDGCRCGWPHRRRQFPRPRARQPRHHAGNACSRSRRVHQLRVDLRTGTACSGCVRRLQSCRHRLHGGTEQETRGRGVHRCAFVHPLEDSFARAGPGDFRWPGFLDVLPPITIDTVLDAVERALQRKRFWVYPGWYTRPSVWARRLTPRLLWWFVRLVERPDAPPGDRHA